MNKDRLIYKQVAGALLASVVLYLVLFPGIEWYRARRGPWEVTFQHQPGNPPSVVIRQPSLRVEAVQLTFADASPTNDTAINQTVRFNTLKKEVPFGQVRFLGATVFPGTINFNLFTHEVQIMPRTLTVNGQEIPWVSETNIVLRGLGRYKNLPDVSQKKPEGKTNSPPHRK